MSLLHRRMMMTQQESMSMDKWELIADITMEETKATISITEDMQGNPFCLKSVEIFIKSMPTEYASATSISASMTKDRIYPVEIGTAAANTETKRYCYGLWQTTGFGIFCTESLRSINGTTNYTGMQALASTGKQAFGDDGAMCPEVCEGIWIGSHYQNVLSPGTRIKIYGVRA